MFYALSFILSSVFMHWAHALADDQVLQASTDLVKTASMSSFSNTSGPLYCGGCLLMAYDGVNFLIPIEPPLYSPITTVSIIENVNGTTTSTFVNSSAAEFITTNYLFPEGIIVTSIPQQIVVDGQLEELTYGTVSTISGSTTCVSQSITFNDAVIALSLPTSYHLPWRTTNNLEIPSSIISSILTSAFSGQPVPTSCSYEFAGEPVYQVPAQFLTTTFNVNNIPASNTGSTTSSTVYSTSSAAARSSTATVASSTSEAVTTPVSQLSNPAPNGPSSSVVDTSIQQSTHNPNTASPTNAPAPSSNEASSTPETSLTTKTQSTTEAPSPNETQSTEVPLPNGIQSTTEVPSPNETPSTTKASSPDESSSPNMTPSLGGISPTLKTPLATETLSSILQSGLVIGSQTLSPGSAITYSGTSISLDTSDSVIVVGSSTIPLTSDAGPACATGSGPGFLIYSVINGCSSVTQGAPTATVQTGGGTKYSVSGWNSCMMLISAFYLAIW